MSLRTQHDLANLRRERALLAASVGGGAGLRLAAVLRAGFERLSVAPTDAGAPRGGRLPHETPAFERDRRWRLTASMLPFWLGLEGQSRPSAKRAEIVRVLGNFNGLWQKPQENKTVREMMEYGRVNEVWGIIGYMEITRSLVGLGSTRVRTSRQNGEGREMWDIWNPDSEWQWHQTLMASPDGFVVDALDSGLGDGLSPFKGLLEVKCPASEYQDNGMPRRHNPEIRLKLEEDSYTLLQCFQQLLVCTEAKHVDIVYFKRYSAPNAQTGAYEMQDHVWIARLYRHQGHMNVLRDLVHDSVELFAKAVASLRSMDDEEGSTTEDDSETRDAYARQAAVWATKLEQADSKFPARDDRRENMMPLSERKRIQAALKAWTHECLRWRNGHEPEEGYPWRSAKDLGGNVDTPEGMKVLEGLCHRFHVNTGKAANHCYDAEETHGTATMGYRPIRPPTVQGRANLGRALEARDIWGTEPIGIV